MLQKLSLGRKYRITPTVKDSTQLLLFQKCTALNSAFNLSPPVGGTGPWTQFHGPSGVISRLCVLAQVLPLTPLLNGTPDYLIVLLDIPSSPL